jgi:electron transfer flavoprotein beta subunit
MAAKRKPVEQLTLADLGIDPGSVGFAGARQEVLSVTPAPPRQAGEVVTDEGSGHERIVAFLEQLSVI